MCHLQRPLQAFRLQLDGNGDLCASSCERQKPTEASLAASGSTGRTLDLRLLVPFLAPLSSGISWPLEPRANPFDQEEIFWGDRGVRIQSMGAG